MSELLHPGDVVLTRSGGIVGWAIPTFTRHFGESRTEATHCAVVVIGGALYDAAIVEALSTVRRHGLRDRYVGRRHYVSVFRALGLADDQIVRLVAKAESYLGRRYGYLKLLAQWADRLLQGAYVFDVSRARMRIPSVAGWWRTPDDIWDFVGDHPDRFLRVLPLTRLASE
jgi:hypothetical protein